MTKREFFDRTLIQIAKTEEPNGLYNWHYKFIHHFENIEKAWVDYVYYSKKYNLDEKEEIEHEMD